MRGILRRLLLAGVVSCAAITLMGCAVHEPHETYEPYEADGHDRNSGQLISTEPSQLTCAGIYVLVDFGKLGLPNESACVDTNEPTAAIDALKQAGIAVTESEAFPDSICQVSGEPEVTEQLSYNGKIHREDCVNMAPEWAYWGLLHDSGFGWEYASEGVSTLLVQPGESLGFVWQFGETHILRLPDN